MLTNKQENNILEKYLLLYIFTKVVNTSLIKFTTFNNVQNDNKDFTHLIGTLNIGSMYTMFN